MLQNYFDYLILTANAVIKCLTIKEKTLKDYRDIAITKMGQI